MSAPAFPPPYDVVVDDLNGDYKLGSRWSGGVGANWQVNDQTLWYTTFSKGFKSGGFFGGFIFDRAEFASYKEETVLAYESGIKTQSADNRLRVNAAAFYYDYRDVQGFVNVETSPNGGTSLILERLATLGNAEHSGVDIDLVWLAGPRISLTAALGYLDAKITSHARTTLNTPGDVVSTQGRRAYAPRWSGALGAAYTRPVSAAYTVQTGFSWNYRSDFSGSLSSPVDKAMRHLDGYGLVDAYVTLSSLKGGLSFSLWGKNLTNNVYSPRKTYDSLGSFVEIMGQPRSLGLQARYEW